MKVFRFALRALWRDSRGGELWVLLAALSVAVGSVSAVGLLTDRVRQVVSAQASEVLAADLRLRSPVALNPEHLVAADEQGLRTATTTRFPSVVFFGDDSALAGLKGVSDNYPLRGKLRVAADLLAEPVETNELPATGELWAETAVLARLGAAPGDTVQLGEREFKVAKVLSYQPDQAGGFTSFAPSILLREEDLLSTGLLGPGSRVSYAQLFSGERSGIDAFVQQLKPDLPDSVRLETDGEAGGRLNQAINRASRFLALASLVSLLLAAVAVAMSARRYAEQRLDLAALMKSLGAAQNQVLAVNALQLLVIALAAGVIGGALGFLGERALSGILADMLRADLPAASWKPIALGFSTALILLTGFALPSLLRLRRSPPLRVLRHDLDAPPPAAWLSYGLAIFSLGAMVYWSVRDLKLVALILGGSATTAILLYLAGRTLVRLLGGFRQSVGVSWRYGLANVVRRGQLSAIQVVAFGLGLMVLLFLSLVRNDLMASWKDSISEDVPNRFLINIQPHELEGITRLLADNAIEAPQFVPLVRARMTRIGDAPVAEREYPSDRGAGFVRREANLTFASEFPPANTLVEGEWWSAEGPQEPEVSVDAEVAADLGLELGESLDFLIAGETLRATITSTREIDWDSFSPNFFMVLSPGALEDYPKTYVTSLRVSAASAPAMLKLVREFPSVSVIDLDAILQQIRTVIDRASLAVQAVFAFTILAGLVVLFAAVQSTLTERRYESALLRTFGANSRTVTVGVAAEFLVLGIVAGLFAAIGAALLGWLAARELFGLAYTFNPMLLLVAVPGGALIVGVCGLLAARSAINSAPIQVLRHNA